MRPVLSFYTIVDINGNIVVEYVYDAWGNFEICGEDEDLGNINPFRYRSYYYDTETGLYYLQTRYYDPETGRFINMDSIAYANPNSINGLNLYAYCGNNPVMRVDPTGHFAWLLFLAVAALCLFTPVGGVVAQTVATTLSYVGAAVISTWDEEVREDMNNIHWNPFNSDEEEVVKSHKVSFYKGAPVVRYSPSNKRSGTFLAIFLARGDNTTVDTVKHEWGHIAQQMMMGPGTYGITVGIPSPLNLGSWDNYYSAPWETMADILGGAGRNHSDEEIKRAWAYYVVSITFPPAAFLFLL